MPIPANYHGPINENPGPGEARIIIYGDITASMVWAFVDFVLGYAPRLAVGLSGCILFGLFLLAHIWYLARYRHTRIFQLLLIIGCAMEVVRSVFLRLRLFIDTLAGEGRVRLSCSVALQSF